VIRLAVALGAALIAAPALAQTVAPSNPADYPDAPGREEAVTFCGACHSFRLVAAQGMTRMAWDESLRWMVQRHNMPELDKEDRDVILAYLERAFPPKAAGGRPGWTNPFAPQK
jgi:mono/diheme cytochrome c family protein